MGRGARIDGNGATVFGTGTPIQKNSPGAEAAWGGGAWALRPAFETALPRRGVERDGAGLGRGLQTAPARRRRGFPAFPVRRAYQRRLGRGSASKA